MNDRTYAIGQAVFLRTDTPDYIEETKPFTNLAELVRICSQPQPNLTLERILVYSMIDEEPHAVTLGFIAASRGQTPDNLPMPGY